MAESEPVFITDDAGVIYEIHGYTPGDAVRWDEALPVETQPVPREARERPSFESAVSDSTLPIAETIPLPTRESEAALPLLPALPDASEPVTPPPSARDDEVLPPAVPVISDSGDELNVPGAVGLPAELADFEYELSLVITISDRASRVKRACEQQSNLRDAGRSIAQAPILEMTNRNLDSWKSGVASLTESLEGLAAACRDIPRDNAAVDSALQRAAKVWQGLMASRG